MTTSAAELPASYDFDEHWAPLPRLNQGAEPTCWYHQWAVHLSALRRCWDDRVVDYGADTTRGFAQDPDGVGFTFHTPDGDMHLRNYSGGENPRYFADPAHQTPDEIRRAIVRNGVVQLSIASRGGYLGTAGGDRSTLPVIDVGPGMPAAPIDHSTLGVGFTDDGVIDQNSWGFDWGCRGRVILTWAWLAFYGCVVSVERYADYPVDGLVLPPARPVSPSGPIGPPAPAPDAHRNPYPTPNYTDRHISFAHLTGTVDPAVRWAQWALGVRPTGIVDRASQQALLRWKTSHRLPASAVVDGPTGRGLAKVTR